MSQGERRLAAIMFTDMVGYTALAQSNESQAMEVLERHNRLLRPLFPKFHGKEVKAIGDSFLVEFESALDALRCAIEIQSYLHDYNFSSNDVWKISLRIGIHLGDVIHQVNDVFGDAVNIASRIEPVAEPEGICISQQVYDQVMNKSSWSLVKLQPRDLKNVRFPIDVYKVVMPWEEEQAVPAVKLDVKRVAVLPFTNMSPDPGDEYFADGMTEEIISTVSKVGGIEVISRTSVMQYKKTPKPVKEVSRELDVGTVLEGSVRKAGDRLRVTVQMIDAGRDKHLWAESYDRDLKDVFAIQNDIARQVAEALQVRLLPDERVRLEKPPTSSVEAYTLYLKAEFYTRRMTEDALREAIGFYEQAIAKDPNFALAQVGLAMAYSYLGILGIVSSKEAGFEAKKHAEKSLYLDDSLAEAHVAMAWVLTFNDWDFPAAEKECKLALELNPNLALAHVEMAFLALFDRRFDEAISEVDRALALDPMSAEVNQRAGVVFLYSRKYDDAIQQFNRALAIDPDNEFARFNLGLAHVQKGMFEVGLQEMQKKVSKSDLAYAYSKAGRLDDVKKLLNELLGEVDKNSELAIGVAAAYANLGDHERAIDWLERAFTDRASYLAAANVDFVFDTIRKDLRFQALMKRLGYTNYE